MNDLLGQTLTDGGTHLRISDEELVRIERNRGDEAMLRNIFHLVHTIRGAGDFLSLPRLEGLPHAAENFIGRFRGERPTAADSVILVLAILDRLKEILGALEAFGAEHEGTDDDIICALECMAAEPELVGANAEAEAWLALARPECSVPGHDETASLAHAFGAAFQAVVDAAQQTFERNGVVFTWITAPPCSLYLHER